MMPSKRLALKKVLPGFRHGKFVLVPWEKLWGFRRGNPRSEAALGLFFWLGEENFISSAVRRRDAESCDCSQGWKKGAGLPLPWQEARVDGGEVAGGLENP